MDQLPQELIDRISSYLSSETLKNTLLLSRAFRYPAERYSGAFTRYALDEDNAARFISTFSGHRIFYLRNLEFEIILPPPADSRYRDDAKQLSKLDNSFSDQVVFLFKTLKTVEERAGSKLENAKVRLAISPLRRLIPTQGTLSWHDYLSWRIHLLEPKELPSLSSVRSLELGGAWQGLCRRGQDDTKYKLEPVKLDYRIMVDLCSRLPNLEYWGCRIGGDEWSAKTEQAAAQYFTQDWAGPRRDTRRDFATALLSADLPVSLQNVRLDFLHDWREITYIDHLTAQPNLTSPSVNDTFSTSLQNLSHHLRRLHLRVLADESLFWPNHNATTAWPKLESLIVMFHMVSPSGKWYFMGPNGEGRDTVGSRITDYAYPPLNTTAFDREMEFQIDTEGDRRYRGCENTRIRIVPNDTVLRPFLAAFAKAASNMEALQEAMLWCALAWDPKDEENYEDAAEWLPEARGLDPADLAWGVHYQGSNEPDLYQRGGQVLLKSPVLWWKVGKRRPDPELHELFLQIGRSPGGGGVEEYWKDEFYGDRLVCRDYFEYHAQEEVDKVG